MLSDDEKLKIKEEEIYRQEIIKSLQPEKSKSQRIIDFFNSSLGNWILTSILIGLITFSYNYFHDSYQRKRDKEHRIEKIDFELQSRLYQFKTNLETLNKLLKEPIDTSNRYSGMTRLGTSRFMQYFNQTGLYDTWLKFKNGEQFEMLSIQYPEFVNRSMISLIGELIDNTDNSEDIKKLASVRKYVMADAMFDTRNSRSVEIDTLNLNRLIKYFDNYIIIDRWKIRN